MHQVFSKFFLKKVRAFCKNSSKTYKFSILVKFFIQYFDQSWEFSCKQIFIFWQQQFQLFLFFFTKIVVVIVFVVVVIFIFPTFTIIYYFIFHLFLCKIIFIFPKCNKNNFNAGLLLLFLLSFYL